MGARWRGEGGERGRGTAVRYGGPGGLGGAGIGGVRWRKRRGRRGWERDNLVNEGSSDYALRVTSNRDETGIGLGR